MSDELSKIESVIKSVYNNIIKSVPYDIISIFLGFIIFFGLLLESYLAPCNNGQFPWNFTLKNQLEMLMLSFLIAFQYWGVQYLKEKIREIFGDNLFKEITQENWKLFVFFGILFILRDFHYSISTLSFKSISWGEVIWKLLFYYFLFYILSILFNTNKGIDKINPDEIENSRLAKIKYFILDATTYYFLLLTIIIFSSYDLMMSSSDIKDLKFTFISYTQLLLIIILILVGIHLYFSANKKIKKIFEIRIDKEIKKITELYEDEYKKLEEFLSNENAMNRYNHIQKFAIAFQNLDRVKNSIFRLKGYEKIRLRTILELIGVFISSIISFIGLLLKFA
ncbi:MAG: hypothetical protein O8C61_10080 [Candidatus Methanoperedens sp.]|nr:hypothetical protein [Candidatus Methanoperedens sp.]